MNARELTPADAPALAGTGSDHSGWIHTVVRDSLPPC